MRTGERKQKPARILTPAEFKRRAWACGGILLATAVAAVSLIDSDGRKTSGRAICEGEQPYMVESGDGKSHLLAEIDGGIDNPSDATEAMQRLNPDLAGQLGEAHPILREGMTVTIPEACYPENANRPAAR